MASENARQSTSTHACAATLSLPILSNLQLLATILPAIIILVSLIIL